MFLIKSSAEPWSRSTAAAADERKQRLHGAEASQTAVQLIKPKCALNIRQSSLRRQNEQLSLCGIDLIIFRLFSIASRFAVEPTYAQAFAQQFEAESKRNGNFSASPICIRFGHNFLISPYCLRAAEKRSYFMTFAQMKFDGAERARSSRRYKIGIINSIIDVATEV